MRYSYATILSSENFLPGVKKLYKGIRKYSDIEFTVFIDDNISESVKEKLQALGMTVIREKEPIFGESVISEKQSKDRWNKTLFKLVIFKEYGFDKLVYLDSDLLIRGNLDDLFEKPEWSAVPDKLFFPECGREGLNAGVITVVPSNRTYDALTNLVKKVAEKHEIFGDQDVLNEYLTDWDTRGELHLGSEYNTCFYSKKSNKNPKVVHFIFESKPWMWSRKQLFLKKIKWFLTFQNRKNKFIDEYLRG